MTRRLLGFLRATSWLVLAASFTCLPFRSALAEDIKIGVLEPFTGPWAKNGNESYVAMEIARDMINEKGGIRGDKSLSSAVTRPTPAPGKVRPSGSSTRTASS
jgi:branched-chain amino acid transport system substrate-binding protein